MVLVWNPGKESPIHDHPCNGCWVRVLENSVQEVVYEKIEDGSLEVQTDTLYNSGGVTWMHDIKGFHKIGNPNEDVAVTLHVYSPPYGQCKIFEQDGSNKTVNCVFDTEGGIPVAQSSAPQITGVSSIK